MKKRDKNIRTAMIKRKSQNFKRGNETYKHTRKWKQKEENKQVTLSG